ncbi:PCMD domain-containing protein, partial [Parabacteroides sp. OttesenSCG-928-K15]|nr:PCMD domain-containing protein [Parabacteroides sp. OttesenSCG-928-K15]
MNATKFLFPAVIALLYLFTTSCIQPEALNSEADIEVCSIAGDLLISPPKIENNRVTLMLSPKADITRLALDFTLTPGATILPANGTVLDYRQPQTFVVTSEDGKWNKTYTVSCMVDKMSTVFGFEHYRTLTDKTSGKELYHEFYEVAVEGGELVEQNIWASGNPGFKLVASGKLPDEYPTVSSPDGMTGRCLKLETRSTGSVGALLNMRLAAGNLFIGSYSGSLNAAKATLFGFPFPIVPAGLCGYYKYKAGDMYTDRKGVEYPDKKDNFDIYCIMYETDESGKQLDGTHNFESPNMVAMARIPDAEKKETDEWTYFYLPIEVLPGKTIDPVKLANNRYNLSIVFSS